MALSPMLLLMGGVILSGCSLKKEESVKLVAHYVEAIPLPLQDGLNFRVDGDVRLVEAVDGIGGAGCPGEVKVATDVVILVECAENALDIAPAQAKIRKWRQGREPAGNGQIFFDNFFQVHGVRSTGTRPNHRRAR